MVGTRFGSPSATIWSSAASGSAVAATPPATQVVGPGASVVSTATRSNPGNHAVFLGIGALIILVLIRSSLPEGRRVLGPENVAKGL